jgi:hypothetical protein
MRTVTSDDPVALVGRRHDHRHVAERRVRPVRDPPPERRLAVRGRNGHHGAGDVALARDFDRHVERVLALDDRRAQQATAGAQDVLAGTTPVIVMRPSASIGACSAPPGAGWDRGPG